MPLQRLVRGNQYLMRTQCRGSTIAVSSHTSFIGLYSSGEVLLRSNFPAAQLNRIKTLIRQFSTPKIQRDAEQEVAE